MGQIAATVMNAVDTRVFECLLPDDEQLDLLAARLAEILRFPVVGHDNYPLSYGLIVKGGGMLSPDSALGDIDLPEPLVMRLVPELCANSGSYTITKGEHPKQRTMFSPIKAVEITPFQPKSSLAGFDIWLDAAVHKDIESYARLHAETECIGLLLGSVEESNSQRVVHISAAIFADEAVGSRTNVRLTLAAWSKILAIRDTRYASLQVLGWFHTHIGTGVYMSDSDMFIHNRFFEQKDMVAYVLDPTSERDAFFRWRDGQVVPCASYGLACSAESEVKLPDNKNLRKPNWRKIISWGLGFLLAIVLGFAIFAYLPFVRDNRPKTPVPAPVKRAEPVAKDAEITYIVSGGETLWSLCKQVYGNGSLAHALARYNGLRSQHSMRAGQQLRIPSREVLDNMGSAAKRNK